MYRITTNLMNTQIRVEVQFKKGFGTKIFFQFRFPIPGTKKSNFHKKRKYFSSKIFEILGISRFFGGEIQKFGKIT